MPNRIIRESCRTSATLYLLSHGAERMFWRLTTIADDHGRFEADVRVLMAQCFPLWAGRIKVSEIAKWYAEMEKAGLVQSYLVNGKAYGHFLTWETHQYVRAKKSKHPAPTSDNICSQPLADVPEDTRIRGYENTRNEDTRSEKSDDLSPAAPEPADAPDWGKPQHLADLYNRLTPEDHPKVNPKYLTGKRLEKTRSYLKTFPERSFWVRVFTEIKFSKFLCRGSPDRPKFRGDFDWLLTVGKNGTENAIKVAEGKYRDT